MLKTFKRASLAFSLTLAMLVSCLSFSAAAAVTEDKFVDDCGDLSVVSGGASDWEVLESPYIAGEKFYQRKADLDPDPFEASLIYTKADRTIKDFKFTLSSFKFDYTAHIDVYVSTNGTDYEKVQFSKTELVEIGAQEYPDGARDVTWKYEVTNKEPLPVGVTHVKLETRRENYGHGVMKVEITYLEGKQDEIPEPEKPARPASFTDDFSINAEEGSPSQNMVEISKGLVCTPNPDVKRDLIGKTDAAEQSFVYKLPNLINITDGFTFEIEAYSAFDMGNVLKDIEVYVADDSKDWKKVELSATKPVKPSGQEYWVKTAVTPKARVEGTPTYMKVVFVKDMNPNWATCLASVKLDTAKSDKPVNPSTGSTAAVVALIPVALLSGAVVLASRKNRAK